MDYDQVFLCRLQGSLHTAPYKGVVACLLQLLFSQCAKKVVPDSPERVDFAIGLVNSVLSLPDGQVKSFEEFKLEKNCVINPAYQNVFRDS